MSDLRILVVKGVRNCALALRQPHTDSLTEHRARKRGHRLMSMHALAATIGFVCSALGIWLAVSLLGYSTNPISLLAWSLGIGITCAAVLAIVRSRAV